jgi:aspartyl-tRNA(Asn)/glutamyl-tRNA(Gln) amidotransferase subunit A
MLRTLSAAAEDIRNQRITPVDLLEECLVRIEHGEDRVRAWVFVDWDGARAEAERLTEELRRGQYRGPLHGIPIGIKDIFDVFDWPTAAGSKLWAQSIARRDATGVERLRRAGSVFVGKTVTTQYASFDPPKTTNPWNARRTPGGSSSGSAAAIACGMCLGALGSQTGGSITRPASYCGVAGCKPTYGRVSVHGVVPLAPSMDHPGPIALCVHDLAILLQIIAGADPLDPSCSQLPVPEYAAGLNGTLPPPRLGQVRGLFHDLAEPSVRAMMDHVRERFRSAGAAVSDVALPAGFADVVARHRIVMAVEGAGFHEPRLKKHPEDYLPKIRGLLEEGLACPAPEYARCKDHQRQLTEEMPACFSGLDALLCPGISGPAPDASSTGNPAFQAPWSYTGLPTVSFLAGHSPEGLPLTIQLVGRPWSEAQLFRAAAWCERTLGMEIKEPPA